MLGSSKTWRTAAAMFACSVWGVRSTGLPTAANGATSVRSAARVASPRAGTSSPSRSAVSAAITDGPARHGDHRHPAREGPARGDGDQRLDGVEELLRLLRQHHPRAGARRPVDLPGAGQRAGVGAGGPAAGVGAAPLEHDDRLAPDRALGGGQEARAVAQRLHEARDQRGGRVVHQPLDHLGDVHVGLVADRQETRDAETARCRGGGRSGRRRRRSARRPRCRRSGAADPRSRCR